MNGLRLKLTVYFAENARVGRHLLSDELGDIYEEHAVDAAILLRATEGFGVKHQLRDDRSVDVAFDLPLVSLAIASPATLAGMLPSIRPRLRSGLLTVERATLATGSLAPATRAPAGHEEVKLTLLVGRGGRAGGRAGFIHLVDVLHQQGAAGATALLGLDGIIDGTRRRARFFSTNRDVPVKVVAVGSRDRIEHALAHLDAALERPFATVERVTVCKRDGARLAHPTGAPPAGAAGWHRLTVYAASTADHHRIPLRQALVRALYERNVSGATVVRGIWGFSGDHPPHGDSLLTLRRDSPIIATVVCPPEELDAAWSAIDTVTAEHGLVTAEGVPALRTIAPGVETDLLDVAQFEGGIA